MLDKTEKEETTKYWVITKLESGGGGFGKDASKALRPICSVIIYLLGYSKASVLKDS